MLRPRYLWSVFLLGLLMAVACQPDHRTFVVGGGPAGGTFQGYAEALVRVVAGEEMNVRWRVKPSGGSISNLKDLDRGDVDLALVYAGDAWLAREGHLPDLPLTAKNVRALGRLYGAAAQLVVPASSPHHQLTDFSGARIAIGNPGSGSALAAQRYFSSLGLWDKIVPIHVGFGMGLKELERGSVHAVWMVVGYPNRALVKEAETMSVRFIDLYSEARESGFFRDYPFYSELEIPAGTYPGQQRRIWTFQDSALLMARLDLDPSLVYTLLGRLYSPAGREEMARSHPVGGELDPDQGLKGVKVPLHSAAGRYWREKGML